MASYGWQNEIHVGWGASRAVEFKANINIRGFSHEGNKLHVWGQLALCPRPAIPNGWDYYVDPVKGDVNGSGGSFGTHFGTGYGGDKYVDFDTWLDCPAGDTTKTIVDHVYTNGYWNSWPQWTIDITPSNTPPSGLSVGVNFRKWNEISLNLSIDSYGRPSDNSKRYIEGAIALPSDTGYGQHDFYRSAGAVKSGTISLYNGGGNDRGFGRILGMRAFKIGLFATNGAPNNNYTMFLGSTVYHNPAAPGSLSFTHTTGSGTYTFKYATSSSNNYSGYDRDSYEVYIRYSLNGSKWNHQVYRISPGQTASRTISAGPGDTLKVQAYQEYYGLRSEVSEKSVTNTDIVPPSTPSVSLVSRKWNSITGTVSISSYGYPSNDPYRSIGLSVCRDKEGRQRRTKNVTVAKSATITVDNNSGSYDHGFDKVVGMKPFYIMGRATNVSADSSHVNSTLYRTPPSPGLLTYEKKDALGGYEVKALSPYGDNVHDYDESKFFVFIKVTVDGAAPTTNKYPARVGGSVKQRVEVPFGKKAQVSVWYEYDGDPSETATTTISNNEDPILLYGPVEGKSKIIRKLYGPDNGKATQIFRLYGSVNGVSKLIYLNNTRPEYWVGESIGPFPEVAKVFGDKVTIDGDNINIVFADKFPGYSPDFYKFAYHFHSKEDSVGKKIHIGNTTWVVDPEQVREKDGVLVGLFMNTDGEPQQS